MIEQVLMSGFLMSGFLILWKEASKHGHIPASKSRNAIIRWITGTTAGCAATMSVIFSLFFEPLSGWIPQPRFPVLWGSDAILPFLIQAVMLVSVTLVCYGTLLLLMSGSHYLAHKAEEYHQ